MHSVRAACSVLVRCKGCATSVCTAHVRKNSVINQGVATCSRCTVNIGANFANSRPTFHYQEAQMRSTRSTQSRLDSTAALFGSTIEWYDFFVYGTAAATVFGPLFFAKSDPSTGLLAAFATFAVGFAARPIGGAVFGHIGDRFGRKRALLATLTIMGAATTLIGFLPTYA